MAINDNWPVNWAATPYVTTSTTSTNALNTIWVAAPNSTMGPYTYVPLAPSAGHIPAYDPPSLAEDEMAWLRRRITEVTDLFPVAA